MFQTLIDKLGDLIVLAVIGVSTFVFRKAASVERKLNSIELDIARNYVTKQELKTVEDKIDHFSETINTKIDTITNILISKE